MLINVYKTPTGNDLTCGTQALFFNIRRNLTVAVAVAGRMLIGGPMQRALDLAKYFYIALIR